MASTAIRERRRTLRYRNLLVRQIVQMKNKISGLLMEAGVSYNKQRLHKAGYFRELLATNPDIDEGLCSLLRLCRETVVRLQKTESALIRSLQSDSLLLERVERLMSIPAVGPITALTWALEVGDVKRFSSIKKAISYCGLCGAERSSADITKRTPTLEITQQTSADGADRSGQDGAAKQPRTGDGIRTGETKRQCQPRNTGRSAEDGGVPGRCGSPAKRLSGSGKQKPHRYVACAKYRRI